MWQQQPFKGGIHNPAKLLNEMATEVFGSQLQVLPPLVLESTGVATLLRLDETASEEHNFKAKTLTDTDTVAVSNSKSYDLLTPPRSGVYLLSGRLFLYCDTRTRGYQNAEVSFAINDAFTAYGLTQLCFPPDSAGNITVNPCFLLYVTPAALAAVPSGREFLQVKVNNPGQPNSSSVTVGLSTGYFEAVRLFENVTA